MATPEGITKQLIKKWLATIKNLWFFMPVQMGYGKAGVPDFIACVPIVVTEDMVGKTIGVFLGIEAKAKGNAKGTTKLQEITLQQIKDAGGFAFVVSCEEELDIVKAALNVSNSRSPSSAI